MIFITGFKSILNIILKPETAMQGIKKSLRNGEILGLFFIQNIEDDLASLSDFFF